MGACTDVCSIILAIILPPLGVLLRFGCTREFVICIILSLLGYIPGIIYALYVLIVTPPETEEGHQQV